jgi:thiol-disulfide isomerase/thioredoxin
MGAENKESKVKTINLNKRTKNKANNALQEGIVIIAFMAPWCQHCKELKPTWKTLMNKYRKLASNTPCSLMQSMEGTQGFLNVNDNEPSGWPTIRVFRNGAKQKDYDGARDANSLINFINSEFGLVMSGGRKKQRRRQTRKKRKSMRRRKSRKRKRYFFGLF